MKEKELSKDQQRRINELMEEFYKESDELPEIAPLPKNTLNSKWDREQSMPGRELYVKYYKLIEKIKNE